MGVKFCLLLLAPYIGLGAESEFTLANGLHFVVTRLKWRPKPPTPGRKHFVATQGAGAGLVETGPQEHWI